MSRDGYPRRHSGGAALLLLIAAVALVVAVLAIFTSVFEKDKSKPDDTPAVDVTQPTDPDDTTPDVPVDPDNGDSVPDSIDKPDTSGKTDGSQLDDPTRPASGTITTSEKPYQSGGVYVVGNTGYEMYN